MTKWIPAYAGMTNPNKQANVSSSDFRGTRKSYREPIKKTTYKQTLKA
ncbi:hypothetical protein ADIWIN_3305 [Winogradskyella psychrotolerans RS-3]|uniref:Uncharacterized protein n=1 Tax=Winogradskyella psychrotolerans RS-3 TaxID=641526 RepID=S7X4H0_9FLAO|nr:hypothetical protein ADIWIN_3305 [Winogradskyella psychrotolerans RS-3]